MLEQIVTTESAELYRRLIAGEYHVLEVASDDVDDLEASERELVDKGLARLEPGEPPLLLPIAPAVAAQAVLQRLTTGLISWQDQTAGTVRQLIELQRDAIASNGGAVHSLAQVITDPVRIPALVDDIQRNARTELLSLDMQKAAGSVCLPRMSPAVENPPPDWRTIFTTDFLASELKWMIDATLANGGQVRIATTLPMKLLIADRSQALVPLDQSGSSGIVLFHSPTVIGALVELFDHLWSRAAPHPPEGNVAGDLTPYEQHVLGLLAAGLKDEEIAVRTNVSIRTVRRNVASVLAKLGVTTRFAAGVHAAKRNWV